MRPQNNSHSPQSSPARDIAVPERDAAANIVRSQLNALYNDGSTPTSPTPAPVTTPSTPTPKQQPTSPASATPADNWQQYHNAWQEYYQEYYNRYYTGHVHRLLNEERGKKGQPDTATPIDESSKPTPADVDTIKQKVLDKVQTSAKKARKSRHFIPISAAVLVVGMFAFLQYNGLIIGTVQAYVSPGTIDPQNIVVDPNADVQVSADPKLIIPKINVDVPVIYGVANTHDAQMAAMQNGVAHFAIPGADSVPGQVGNTAISGHSSNDLFEPGDYKFVFSQLSKLENGDTIYANYNSVRYTYTVTKKEIVQPTDVKALTYATDKPVLTLITCWPLGTANQRMLITAEQVSPDPTKAPAAQQSSGSGSAMPGNSATALEKLFGSKG